MVAANIKTQADNTRTRQTERTIDLLVLSAGATLEPHAASLCDTLRQTGYCVWRSADEIVSSFPRRRITNRDLQRVVVAIQLFGSDSPDSEPTQAELTRFLNAQSLLHRRAVIHVGAKPPVDVRPVNGSGGDDSLWVDASSDFEGFTQNLLHALAATDGLCRSVTRARRRETISEIEAVEQLLTVAMLTLLPISAQTKEHKQHVDVQAAWTAASKDDPTPAIELFTTLSKNNRQQHAALTMAAIYRCLAYVAYLNNTDVAIEALRHATTFDHSDAKTLFYLSCLLNRNGEFEQFDEVSERIINGDPTRTDTAIMALAHENMGHVSWNEERYEEAEHHYRRGIELALEGRHYELAANIRFVVAQLLYERFIEGENATGRYNYRAKHQSEMANVQRLALKRTDPVFFADLNMQIGDFYARSDDYVDAQKAWRKAQRAYAKLGIQDRSNRARNRRNTTVAHHNMSARVAHTIWAVLSAIVRLFVH